MLAARVPPPLPGTAATVASATDDPAVGVSQVFSARACLRAPCSHDVGLASGRVTLPAKTWKLPAHVTKYRAVRVHTLHGDQFSERFLFGASERLHDTTRWSALLHEEGCSIVLPAASLPGACCALGLTGCASSEFVLMGEHHSHSWNTGL